MRKIFVIALSLVATAAPTLANAQSSAREQTRVIDGTIGAVAGAMIAGPIGLIAGAVLGYTVGPEVTGPVLNPPLRRTRTARRHRRRAPAAAYAQQQPQQPAYQGYAQPAYPQQPVYMAQPQPVAQAYQPLPAQQPMQQGAPMYAPQRQAFNPRQNALVPPPDMVGGGQQYTAVAGAPAPGVPGAPGAAYSPYPQQAPAYGRMPQVQAPPVPMPR